MATDICFQSRVLRYAPRWLEPYLRLIRLDRPTGIFLILIPSFWGLLGTASVAPSSILSSVASDTHGELPPSGLFIIFTLGAFVMRSAGCVLNDLVDKNLDQRVERTQKRPLASGELTLLQGFVCLAFLLSIALGLLLLLPPTTWLLGFIAVILTGVYPFMKRVTYWPQAFLGLAMNWGILMAEGTLQGGVTLKGGLLFLTGFCWTLFYDTLYAHQDKEDDLLVGIKSLALKCQGKTKAFLRGVLLVKLVCFVGFHFWGRPLSFYAWGCLIGAFASLVYILETVDLERPRSCLKAFKRSQVFGWLVLAALL